MPSITANDLKTKGVSALETALEGQDEAIISVRGKPRYVVMDIEHYEQLREAEIFAAWQEVRAEVAKGGYVAESAEEHISRLKKELPPDAV
ncbi:type II toxin-antitoxin system prevent-host-death family antitoxin [Methylocaldum sp.]|uniref:type II toxin-antitoxin system prevent-host-death family antitoxin n=1 Tax=Methylocaldum sp. TaxID=1969727 RepID=UPI002D3ACD98|nr:type II toxin-antitoxin system prevent-host-death family antitoxin [Methylocaldum sp.]HYE36309.1 type II toxin-antitoxin system prevent-host-death family antitoxin [Methylocaldum sp.]